MASEEPKGTKRKEPEDTFMSPFTLKRLTKELKKIPTDSRTSSERYTVELEHDDMSRWVVRYYYDDLPEDCNAHAKVIAQELAKNDLSYVEFKLIYSNEYPGKPPFCFNSYPPMWGRFLSQCGALCHEQLHPNHGWQASMCMAQFVVGLRSILEEDCRIRLLDRKRRIRVEEDVDPDNVNHEQQAAEADSAASGSASTLEKEVFVPNEEETARRTNDFYLAAHTSGY